MAQSHENELRKSDKDSYEAKSQALIVSFYDEVIYFIISKCCLERGLNRVWKEVGVHTHFDIAAPPPPATTHTRDVTLKMSIATLDET